jgi:hypothetical protein
MLRRLRDVELYKVSAVDGKLGSIADFLLDDEQWAVRYLQVATADLTEARNILVSPMSLSEIDWSDRHFHLTLTVDQAKSGRTADLNKPASRHHRGAGSDCNRPAREWGSSWLWGSGAVCRASAAGRPRNDPPPLSAVRVALPVDDEHLRSVTELRGYHVEGADGGIGRVEDFIVDDVTWRLPYLVVDTHESWAGHHVLVAPHWASRIDWSERSVHLDMSRDSIKSAPPWVSEAPISRAYQNRLDDFYGRPAYWVGAVRPQGSAHLPSLSHP